jgi:glycogen debranching enzyme
MKKRTFEETLKLLQAKKETEVLRETNERFDELFSAQFIGQNNARFRNMACDDKNIDVMFGGVK